LFYAGGHFLTVLVRLSELLSRVLPVYQDLTAKARQLQLTAAELQQLKEDHSSLQARTAALSQQLVATTGSLGEAQAAQQQAAAEVLQLGSQLEQAEHEKAQLMRQVCTIWCVSTLL
jgi:chromosome segregation ATPase